jgi:hypothetical protein
LSRSPSSPSLWGNVASVNGSLIAIVAPGALALALGAKFGIFRLTVGRETPVADVVRER